MVTFISDNLYSVNSMNGMMNATPGIIGTPGLIGTPGMMGNPGVIGTPGVINNSVVTKQPPVFQSQKTFPSQPLSNIHPIHIPNVYPEVIKQPPVFQSEQTFSPQPLPNMHPIHIPNVYPEVSAAKAWTFPNGSGTSGLVRFTATTVPSSSNLYCSYAELNKQVNEKLRKRKSSGQDEILPSKMQITEEKMAARMSGMHISNDFVSHNEDKLVLSDTEEVYESEELQKSQPSSSEGNSQPQLIICDELKKLGMDMNDLFPEPLIPVEKPSTALVLWRPPMSYLNIIRVPSEEEYCTRSSVIITDITDTPDLDSSSSSSISNMTSINGIDTSSVEYPQDGLEEMEM